MKPRALSTYLKCRENQRRAGGAGQQLAIDWPAYGQRFAFDCPLIWPSADQRLATDGPLIG
eukprot:4189378-Lingulodinium_polyedra.AAC.1